MLPQQIRITKVRKRDGRIVPFEEAKIARAIGKAIKAVGDKEAKAEELAGQVVVVLKGRLKGRIPSVEDVQDVVETTLIRNGFAEAAKAYILYRRRRTEIREAKRFFGVEDDLKISLNAIGVLEKRYLLKDARGNVVETPRQMLHRIAKSVARADMLYDGGADVEETEDKFYRMMANLEFLPNSPTMMNAGTKMGQLSACFVIPVEDSIKGIFRAVKQMAIIHQTGGGTGFSFSHLRPQGDVVGSTHGVASGPVSFMGVFDAAAEVMKQGGRRRGANMGILRVDHPDILSFITAKSRGDFLRNFNLSVAVTDDFMQRVERDEEYDLVNPRTGRPVRRLRAKNVVDLIVTQAWATGDPGMVFIDEVNRHNPTPRVGSIESTNPCGEQPLLPYESCNLGSINLSRMVVDGGVDWDRLAASVTASVHFLDNVIDANKYPLKEIERVTKANRKIGLGVMGFADMLIRLGTPYDSEEALGCADRVMAFISEKARDASAGLGEERGSFPNFEGSVWEGKGFKAMRNATITTIAPTGTISIIAGCSSGVEPLFAISFVRNVLEGTRLVEVNEIFEEVARKRGFYSEELVRKIAKTGSVQQMPEIPDDIKRIFVTALDISPEWHVRMQAAFQKHVDNAVSKTVNLPPDSSVEDVRRIYMLAYKLGCKGITVYRYGSKKEQVLYLGSTPGKGEAGMLEYVSAQPEYSGGCPEPVCNLY